MRLTDGWIQELSGGVTFATLYTKQSTAAHAMKGKIESKRLELHGRLASLMPEKASGDFEITDEQSRVAPMPLQSSATQHQQVHHHHHYYANVSPNGNGTITNMPGQKNKTSQDEFVARLQDQVETMNARMIEMQKTLLQMQSTFLEVAKKSNNS